MSEFTEISDLLDDYVICRTIGHAWDDNPTPEIDSDLWRTAKAALFLRCTRCHTERFDYIDSSFNVEYRYYRYPNKYKSIPGQGSRPNLRGEMFRRSLLLRRHGR
jgi:hypothetical protein